MSAENSFAGKAVLVTGGLGFIGSNLTHRLVELGADVLIVDCLAPDHGGNLFNIEGLQGKVALVIQDIGDEDAMSDLVQGREIIFNLAGQVSHVDSMRSPMGDLLSNCRSHLGLLEACRKYNPQAKVVYSSTRQIYGRPHYLPVDESHPIAPVDINGIHKLAGERYHQLYWQVYGLRTVCLRLTNTYGPRQLMKHNRQGFLPWFIRLALDGEEIFVYGDGRQVRDATYVGDVVDALLSAAVSPQADGEVYNLGGCEPIALWDLAQLIVQIAGSGSCRLAPFPTERKAIDLGSFYADYSKVHHSLGWRPVISLRAGLAKTIAYYRQYREQYWETAVVPSPLH